LISGNYKMCKNCQLKPVYEFTNKRKLCKGCFIRYFQKKVLYIIRKFKMIRNSDAVGYEFNSSFRSVVLEDVLKMFAEKSMIDLVKMPSKKKIDKIAIASNIDLECDKIIHVIIKGDSDLKEVSPVDKKVIKPLYLFLDKEILLYAKLRGLKFKRVKETPNQVGLEEGVPSMIRDINIEGKDKISKFIDELEKKHPEVKRAVVNSYLELYN